MKAFKLINNKDNTLNIKNLKPLFGIGVALLFIILGFYLIKEEDQLAITIGYANIVFWSGLILFALYKFITINKA